MSERPGLEREDFEAKQRRYQERTGAFLVWSALVVFVLISAFFMNQAEVVSQKVQLSYLKENIGVELSPNQALAELKSGKFTKVKNDSGELDLGYMREGVWVLMEFVNPPSSTNSSFVLQLRHTYINGSVTEIQNPSSGKELSDATLLETKSFTDKLLPKTQQLNDVRHVSFPVVVEPGKTYRALVRVKAHVMNVPFLLLEERVFLSSVIRELVPLACMFGGLILLALYNAMVGLARREPEFLFYGIYVGAIALMSASINGTGHMFLWSDVLWLHYNSANLLINTVCLSYMGFSYFIFKSTPMSRVEKGVWKFFALLGMTGYVLQVVEGGFFASIQANFMAIATMTLGLTRAWRARAQYGRIANQFILSEGVLFIGGVLYCVKMFGWLPSTTFTLNIVLVSATLEAILLSFVLSEKMRRTMGEKEDALRQLESANAQLEESVRDKTLALAARYTSHEVLNPVFAIRLKTERLCDEMRLEMQSDTPSISRISERVLQKGNDIFKLIDSIIHTIRAIKTMSSDGQREEVTNVDLQGAFDDAVKMLEAKIVQVNCDLQCDFSAASHVQARRTDVVQVMSNLISNSLDALVGREGGWIKVESLVKSPGKNSAAALQWIEVGVTDSGLGPSQEIRSRLFESQVSTKGIEMGMGLGLSFCQRLVKRNGGGIDFDRTSPATRFFFTLPAVQRVQAEENFELQKAS